MFDNLKFWKHDDKNFDSDFSTAKDPLQSSDPFNDDAKQQSNHLSSNPFTDNSANFEMPELHNMQSSFSSQNTQSQNQPIEQQTHQNETQITTRDVELILSRLELIRSELQNLNHRVSNIEQQLKTTAHPEQKQYW